MKKMSDVQVPSCSPMNNATNYVAGCAPINNAPNFQFVPGISPMENIYDDQDFVITNNDMIKRRNLDIDEDGYNGYKVTSDSYDFNSDGGYESEDYGGEDLEVHSNDESYDDYYDHSSGDDSNAVVLPVDH